MKENVKKIKYFVLIIFIILIVSIAIIRIFQTLFTIYLHYDSVMWCNNKNRKALRNEGIYSIGNFSIITLEADYNMENNEVKIMQYFPSLFYKSIEIGVSPEFVREHNGKGEAFIKYSLPYFIILLFCIFIIKYKIIPKME